MEVLWIILRILHIAGAFVWAGFAFTNIAFLGPAVRASGPAGGTVMQNLLRTSLLRAMQIAPLAVALSGLILFWYRSGGLSLDFFGSFKGIVLTIGSLAGLAAFFEGMMIIGPTAARLRDLGGQIQAGGGPPKPEQMAQLQALQARMSSAAIRGAAMLVIAVFGMAIGG